MTKYTRLAETDVQEKAIAAVEKEIAKLGKKIVGATTIGKSPQTVLLDLTYQGGEISINRDGKVRCFDESINLGDCSEAEAKDDEEG